MGEARRPLVRGGIGQYVAADAHVQGRLAMIVTSLICPLLAGCQSVEPSPTRMEDCATATVCTVHGVVAARPAEHAWMGVLSFPDGRCVSVSLPDVMMARLRAEGPREMTVSGRVYGEPPEEIVDLRIEGRKIGFGLCGDFFVYVRDTGNSGNSGDRIPD